MDVDGELKDTVKTNETRKIEALERIAYAIEAIANTIIEDEHGSFIRVCEINKEG